jgi:cysteinyl-tRNA synthetase
MNLTDIDDKTINGAAAEGIACASSLIAMSPRFRGHHELGVERAEHTRAPPSGYRRW